MAIKANQLIKKILKFGFLFLFGIVIVAFSISSRVRKHIRFNIDQIEIYFSLMNQDVIHEDRIHNTELRVVKDSTLNEQIIGEINKRPEIESQRLVYAYHEHLDLNYKLFTFFGEFVEQRLPDIGSPLNQDVLWKTHNFFESGLGGIQLRPSVLIKFTTEEELSQYLSELIQKYTVNKTIELNQERFVVTIKPFIFIDWYWYPVGINPSVLMSYENVDSTNVNELILNSQITGVFGPNIDYVHNLESNFPQILSFTQGFVEKGKLTFAKHFGYRRDNRLSVTGNGIDPHWDMVQITTSREDFFREDLKFHNDLMNSVNSSYLGAMVGHHILNPIDSINLASISPSVMDLINKTLRGLSISDSIGMYGFLDAGEFEDLIKQIQTDLILLSYFDLNKMKGIKTYLDQDYSSSSQEKVRKILDLKYHLGLIEVYAQKENSL